MKLVTIKLNNKNTFRIEFIRFCMKNEISVWLTWQEEDLWEDILFCEVSVPEAAMDKLQAKYHKAIIATETI